MSINTADHIIRCATISYGEMADNRYQYMGIVPQMKYAASKYIIPLELGIATSYEQQIMIFLSLQKNIIFETVMRKYVPIKENSS